MSYPMENSGDMTCHLKNMPFADFMLIACLGALALLTFEVAFIIFMDFIGRTRNKNKTSLIKRWPNEETRSC